MDSSRRDFLRIAGLSLAGLTAGFKNSYSWEMKIPGFNYVEFEGYIVPRDKVEQLKNLAVYLAGKKGGSVYEEKTDKGYLERVLIIMDPDDNKHIQPQDITIMSGWMHQFPLPEINGVIDKIISERVAKR